MISPWPIHTVVFDLDDTLFAESEYVISGFTAVDRWLIETQAVTAFAADATALFKAGVRGTIFDQVLQRLAPFSGTITVAELVRVYREHTPNISPLPDASECLKWARKSFNLALLTDGYASVQQKKIDALGIAAIFDCKILTDELGGRKFWKPNPAGFQKIMTRCPGESGGYVYVADNPHKDFIASRGLGWKSVRIRRPLGEHSRYEPTAEEMADREVKSLSELRDFIVPFQR
jgi:putative hydrolase of the HAD superfamily